jgi:Holliday junction resolvase RusA-like endonuclease
MQEIEITVRGRIPSKKNSRNLFARGGKIINIPSKSYAEWHKDASTQLLKYNLATTSRVECITLRFFAPDKRKSDLTNKAESILDLLVDNKIIEDDNWFLLDKVILEFGGIDRKNPRCEINIKKARKNESKRLQ